MFEAITVAVISSVVTGIVSAASTVKALRVHIDYLRETTKRHENAIERAHSRLDVIEWKNAKSD